MCWCKNVYSNSFTVCHCYGCCSVIVLWCSFPHSEVSEINCIPSGNSTFLLLLAKWQWLGIGCLWVAVTLAIVTGVSILAVPLCPVGTIDVWVYLLAEITWEKWLWSPALRHTPGVPVVGEVAGEDFLIHQLETSMCSIKLLSRKWNLLISESTLTAS